MTTQGRVPALPVSRTALIGRARELATIHEIWLRSQARLLTLTGVGGTGKTRLALQLAVDLEPTYPRRTWVVELAAVTDAELVPIVVATCFGLREISSTAPVQALADYLGDQPALLIIDNCEHLVDACATLADALLSICSNVRIIATSREPLFIAGEYQYRVPPLDAPSPDDRPELISIAASSAVQLFVTRARAVLPAFQLTPDNAMAVAHICARLGGIPLAIELAAARVQVLGVEQILARLDDSFRLLTGGSRVAPTRHQTLKAALDWSDALLSEAERTIFRRLSVFAGEFQIGEAEAVCSCEDLPPTEILDALTGLANKSLVVTVNDGGEAWYHLLEPVRQYALGQLHDRGEVADTESRHSNHYLELAQRAAVEVRGANQEAWLNRLEREQGNFRSALERAVSNADTEAALRLASGLDAFWEVHGHLTEGLRWLRQALSLPSDAVDPALRIRALRGAGRLAYLFEDGGGTHYLEAETLHKESLTLAQHEDDQQGIADALTEIGMVYRMQRELQKSADVLTDALVRHRGLGNQHGVMFTLLNLASTKLVQGDVAQGKRLLIEGMELSRTLGDLRHTAIAQVGLGRTVQSQGGFEEAIELMLAAMSTHLRLGDRWFVIFDLFALADVLIDAGNPRQGVRMMSTAAALSDRLGSQVGGWSFAGLHAKVETLRREQWFENAWAEGHVLEPHDAIREAEELLEGAKSRGCKEPIGGPAASPLTRREREVAKLVAEGLTDRQIADALFVSVGTVGVHVHHILQKLDLQSRVQVAGWLETQGQVRTDSD